MSCMAGFSVVDGQERGVRRPVEGQGVGEVEHLRVTCSAVVDA